MMFNLEKRKNNQRGFTLVEMMVSVSIFVIVAFVVVSTLLTLSYAYKKAQRMRLLLDNLGFSIQSLSLNIREGVNYNQPSACVGLGDCIQFKPLDVWLSGQNQLICYSLYDRGSGAGHGIRKCENLCPCLGEGNSTDIVSPEIDITKLKFEITQGNLDANRVKILISGTAGIGREYTEFFIQNTVSQRNVDQ